MTSPTWLNLPNKITVARLVIATLLFVLLSLEDHSKVGTHVLGSRSLFLNFAAIVFALCVATDWIDGYLARKWGMVTTFGRIADPFVDKIVICGALVYLISIAPTLIKPWFAVTVIAREFLVTSLRSYFESQGVAFGARWVGKAKMVLQSICVTTVLLYQANFEGVDSQFATVGYVACWCLIFATVIVTVGSAFEYVAASLKSGVDVVSKP